jgi:uncharacterized protein (DUF3820 family)
MIINFGKHKGEKFEELPLEYLIFLIRCDTSNSQSCKIIKQNYPEVIDDAKKCFINDVIPDVDYKFNFGKHKDQNIKDVPLKYLFWLIECDTSKYSTCLLIKTKYPDAINAAFTFLKDKRKHYKIIEITEQNIEFFIKFCNITRETDLFYINYFMKPMKYKMIIFIKILNDIVKKLYIEKSINVICKDVFRINQL